MDGVEWDLDLGSDESEMWYSNSARNRNRNRNRNENSREKVLGLDICHLQTLNPLPLLCLLSNVHGIASDYWSLGVLAFELLFGQRPFEKHCPSLHIAYLEESLKRTATKSALRRELQRVS